VNVHTLTVLKVNDFWIYQLRFLGDTHLLEVAMQQMFCKEPKILFLLNDFM